MGTTTDTLEDAADSPVLPAVQPVAPLQQVLAALADPVRLEMVRRLADSGAPMACGQLYDGINKSTASHHFKILREAGLTERVMIGGQAHQLLRLDEVEQALPGVLPAVVTAARA
ncbi:ArsR/SmtB family transcription factor [Nocardioides pocheonensis]|uniref:ArsR family transcriptional regulator n=1 Tax=Nocardioides pocheonensis TaxID=661485 RepID=A0A3N0GJQ0_9ACTN|nr:helix-turn-helix domain-containing protein [Nocardioides pocheonensis]RNM12436.1 ArsR family transcriptional regulator [Nocardioides pocheonensis]